MTSEKREDGLEKRLEEQVRALRRVAGVLAVLEVLVVVWTIGFWTYGIVQLARGAPGGQGPTVELGVLIAIALCEAVRRQSRIVGDLAETVKGIV